MDSGGAEEKCAASSGALARSSVMNIISRTHTHERDKYSMDVKMTPMRELSAPTRKQMAVRLGISRAPGSLAPSGRAGGIGARPGKLMIRSLSKKPGSTGLALRL